MNDFISLEYLGTFAGMVTTLAVLTQIIKKFVTFNPKYVVLGLSFITVTVVHLVIPGIYTAEAVLLAVYNVFSVAAATIGVFEGLIKPVLTSAAKSNTQGDV